MVQIAVACLNTVMEKGLAIAHMAAQFMSSSLDLTHSPKFELQATIDLKWSLTRGKEVSNSWLMLLLGSCSFI